MNGRIQSLVFKPFLHDKCCVRVHTLGADRGILPVMDLIITLIQEFHEDEAGATATEYIVLLILIACFIILVVKQFGQTISEKFGWADERVTKFVVF